MIESIDFGPLISKVHDFELDAHAILGFHEESRSRVVLLERTYQQLDGLSLRQDDLLRQALRCIEHELYRAAHVMCFSAVMDFVLEKLAEDGLIAVRRQRPAWKGVDIYEMSENYPDRQFILLMPEVKLGSKGEARQLGSLLDRRNLCAHPSHYFPDLNMTLGYVSEAIQVIAALQPRKVG